MKAYTAVGHMTKVKYFKIKFRNSTLYSIFKMYFFCLHWVGIFPKMYVL